MSLILAETTVPYSTDELFKKIGISIQTKSSKVENKQKNHSPDTSNIIAFESNRNNTLTSLAGSMRSKGLGVEAIEAALLAANDAHIMPPLPQHEVRSIAASVMRYTSSEDTSEIMQSLNDVGNSLRFENMHQEYLKYVPEFGAWYIWQANRWERDNHGIHVMAMAKRTAASIFHEAACQSDKDARVAVSRFANASNNKVRLVSMIDISSRGTAMCVPAEKLDADPMLLGVANGVINLNTGTLESNYPERFITRYSNVEYKADAQCPTFLEFLNKIFEADSAKIAFIRRIVGYCMTGRTNEQVFFFFFGHGANGKSTLLRIIERLLGADLAKQTPAETLMAKAQNSKQSNDLARLQGVRAVIANEVEDGSFLAESLIKQISGEDVITARYLFKEYFEFRPEFKLIIAGNHKPIIKGTDNGIWRRIVMVNFAVSIPPSEQDPDLFKKLEAELPGILNWAIHGCLEWQASGLDVPKSVANDVQNYREEMDWIGQWLADCCITGTSKTIKANDLYYCYTEWAKSNGMHPSTSTAFGRKLTERGFTKIRRADGYWYQGLTER